MKINELAPGQIKVGMRIRSLVDSSHLGTVVQIDHDDDEFAWILWDGQDEPYSGFYGEDCECEIAE